MVCSAGNANVCFSTYAFKSQDSGGDRYTPLTSLLTLYLNQQNELDANSLVKFDY